MFVLLGWVREVPEATSRAGQTADGRALSDRIASGTLTWVFPPELVDEVVAETGRTEQRHRLLPARVTVYFVLAMCVFFGQGYEEVMRLLVNGLGWAQGWRKSWQVPTSGAISRARDKLGPAPCTHCSPAYAAHWPPRRRWGAWYRDWRLMAIDGVSAARAVELTTPTPCVHNRTLHQSHSRRITVGVGRGQSDHSDRAGQLGR
jgi:Insertion element 4 transposase N-terminal